MLARSCSFLFGSGCVLLAAVRLAYFGNGDLPIAIGFAVLGAVFIWASI